MVGIVGQACGWYAQHTFWPRLSGLAAFVRWDESWRSNIGALMELEHLLAVWDLRMLEARHAADAEQGIATAVQATRDLLEAPARSTSATPSRSSRT